VWAPPFLVTWKVQGCLGRLPSVSPIGSGTGSHGISSIDLKSGRATIEPLYIILFGVGFVEKPQEGTALLQIAFPAGAALFLSRRRRLLAAHRPMTPEDQLPH